MALPFDRSSPRSFGVQTRPYPPLPNDKHDLKSHDRFGPGEAGTRIDQPKELDLALPKFTVPSLKPREDRPSSRNWRFASPASSTRLDLGKATVPNTWATEAPPSLQGLCFRTSGGWVWVDCNPEGTFDCGLVPFKG
jgi:hypothetical protein